MPQELVEEIQKYIDTHKEQGYKSVPEFVREAIRMHLQAKEQELATKTKKAVKTK